MLKKCCCCVSLRHGCIIVGVIYIMTQALFIAFHLETLSWVQKEEGEENEDEENKSQRQRIQTQVYVAMAVLVLKIVVGFCVIYAAWKGKAFLLKGCAVIIVAGTFIPFFLAALRTSDSSLLSYLFDAIIFAICIYFAFVLWSYAVQLDEPEMPLRVYVAPSGHSGHQLQ